MFDGNTDGIVKCRIIALRTAHGDIALFIDSGFYTHCDRSVPEEVLQGRGDERIHSDLQSSQRKLGPHLHAFSFRRTSAVRDADVAARASCHLPEEVFTYRLFRKQF